MTRVADLLPHTPAPPGGGPPHPSWVTVVVLAGLAALGGLARYVAAYPRTRVFDWRVAAASAFVAAFAGFVLAEAALLAGLRTLEHLLIAAAVGGWAGPYALDAIAARWLRRVGDQSAGPPP